MTKKNPDIFFHVGLGKTASTYLQHRVFSHLEGIRYIPTRDYKKSIDLIKKGNDSRYLISREFDRQFEDEVSWFCSYYPDARIIVVFRRHDKWIASQYRRHVKGGFYKEFRDFIDLDENKGFWDRKELVFMDKIKVIEKYSTKPPLVLFHEDLAKNPTQFILQIADYCQSKIDIDSISMRPKHTAWSDKQLLAVRLFRQKVVKREIRGGKNRLEGWLYYRPWWLLFHVVMYAAIFIPKNWFGKKELIAQQDLDKVKNRMEKDWESLKAYAQQLSKAQTPGDEGT